MTEWIFKSCPNYCMYGMYGGGANWRSIKPHMETSWEFCPVCGAKGIEIKSEFTGYTKAHLDYKKEQRRRFFYWLHRRPSDFNWNVCNELPPVPEKPNSRKIKMAPP